MPLFVVTVVWFCTTVFFLMRAVRQFRDYDVIAPSEAMPDQDMPFVDVIIPVRNEETNIKRCLNSLLSQEYKAASITVVDDGSTDNTYAIVNRICEYEKRIRLTKAGELPDGWTGKCHACWKGANKTEAEWLCFLDADTVASPRLLASAVLYAEANGLDFLSLAPFQELKTFWERLVLPTGFLAVSFFTDLGAVNDASSKEAAAVGQCIFVRRRIYEKTGGHSAVRGEISEDSGLARVVKHAGHRIALLGGNDLLKVRLYTGLAPMWEGLSKNVIDIMGGTRRAVISSVGISLFSWLAPILPLMAWRTSAGNHSAIAQLELVLALTGAAAIYATCIAEARYFRIPLWYGLMHPIGFAAILSTTLHSVWMQHTGKVKWKGRVYSILPASAEPLRASYEKEITESLQGNVTDDAS